MPSALVLCFGNPEVSTLFAEDIQRSRPLTHLHHILIYHPRESLLSFHHSKRTRTTKEPTPIPSRTKETTSTNSSIPHQLLHGNSARPLTECPTPFLVSDSCSSSPSNLTFPRRALGPLPDRSRKALIHDAEMPIREDWLRLTAKKEGAIR